MGTHRRAADLGAERGRRLLATLGRELREARLDRGLSTRVVGRAAGMSCASVSRIERGLVANVSIADLASLHLAVGLDLSVRSFPGGQPIRDRAHVALLEAFRGVLPGSVRWRTEVRVAGPGDRRAWDAVIEGRDLGRYGIEAETAPNDVQALCRRLGLKRDDGDVAGILLVLPETRHVRGFLAAGRELLRSEFPVDGERALTLLKAGLDPGGSAILVLEGRFIRRRSGPATGEGQGRCVARSN